MMEGRLYSRTLSMPLGTWQLIEQAKDSRLCREVFGRYPTDAQTFAWLVRLGTARMEQLEHDVERVQEALA